MERLKFTEYCANCRGSLARIEKILFVELEVGRCFCAEDCIREYFRPTVEFMYDELAKLRSENDFNQSETSELAPYQALTLGDPDEVWIEEVESGDKHFTFIASFQKGDRPFYYVVVCLAIEGVPSFALLSFASRDEDLVEEYRRGVNLRSEEPAEEPQIDETLVPHRDETEASLQMDPIDAEQLSATLSDVERLYAELRQPGDIPREEFYKFEPFIESTLDDPDEIWRLIDDEGNDFYTFISLHTKHNLTDIDEFMMIVVCEPVFEENSAAKTFEVVFAFPTIDSGLVQHFRKGVSALHRPFGTGRSGRKAA